MKNKLVLLAMVAMFMAIGGSSQVMAQGGAGGGGATGGGGSTATCTWINTFKASAGYAPSSNSNIGAVWVEYKMNPCMAPSGQGYGLTLTVTNMLTGEVITINPMYAQDKIDFDMLALETPYHISFVATDAITGQVLGSASADVTTPKNNGLL